MTAPNEMRSAESWDQLLTCSPMSPNEALMSVRVKPAEIEAIQADALSWAAGQIKDSHSLEEAVMRLSLKFQELTKVKK